MRIRHILLLAALVIPLVGCTTTRPAHVVDICGPGTFDIPRINGFTARGDPTDRAFSAEIMDAYKLRLDASDFSPSFRLGWDTEGLILFANVTDDYLRPPKDDATLWSGGSDVVFIYVSPEQEMPSARIAVSPVIETNSTSPVILFAPPFEAGTERPNPVRVTFDCSLEKTDTGYTLALRIPWKELRMTPREGLEFGFQVLFQDADGGGIHRWFPQQGTYGNCKRTRRVRLASKPSPPVTAVIDRIAHIRDGSTWMTASAPKQYVGDTLRITDAGKFLVDCELVDDGSGYASTRVILDDNGAHPFPLHTLRKKTCRATAPAVMKAGVATRDITLIDCISGDRRIIDPLLAHVLVIEDPHGTRIAIMTRDLTGRDFPALNERMKKELGIDHTFINASHTHSTGRHSRSKDWYSRTEALLWEAAAEAASNMVPVTLSAGRAPVEIGYNRNREYYSRAIVPWVNVLVVERLERRLEIRGQKSAGPAVTSPDTRHATPLAVLYEYSAHPVITQNSEDISADFPAYAARKIKAELGDAVVAMFAQGCGGSANAWPTGFDVENDWEIQAAKAGEKLGDAVIAAVNDSESLSADRFLVRHKDIEVPCQLPSPVTYTQTVARLQECDPPYQSRESWEKSLEIVKGMMDRGEDPRWATHVEVVMLGDEWCLVVMPGEVYAEYELWTEHRAQHRHKMVLAYTNGRQGHLYHPPDHALRLGIQEPLVAERACNWAASWPAFFSGVYVNGAMLPLAPGTEKIIEDTIADLADAP